MYEGHFWDRVVSKEAAVVQMSTGQKNSAHQQRPPISRRSGVFTCASIHNGGSRAQGEIMQAEGGGGSSGHISSNSDNDNDDGDDDRPTLIRDGAGAPGPALAEAIRNCVGV